jgi:hypothetical protein
MFSDFHFLQFSYFFLPLDTLAFFSTPVLLCLFPSLTTCYQYNFLYPHPMWVFQFMRLDAQFFCLSQPDNLPQCLWKKLPFIHFSHFFYSQFCYPLFIFALFFSILLHHFCLFSSLNFSVHVSCGMFCSCVVPQPPFPHKCGSLCRCNFVSMTVFADAAAQAHSIVDGNTSSRGY